jgi:hypothetical protein
VTCLIDNAVAASTTVAGSATSTVAFAAFELKAAAGLHTCKVTAGELIATPQLQFTSTANEQAAFIRLSLTPAVAAQHGTAALAPAPAPAAAALPVVTQEVSTEAVVYMSVYSKDRTLLPIQAGHSHIAVITSSSTGKLYYSTDAAKQAELCATGKIVLRLPVTACDRVVTVYYYRSAEQYEQDRANSNVDSALFKGQFKYKATLPPLHHLVIEPVHTATAAATATGAVDATAAVVCGATLVNSIVGVIGKSVQGVVVPVSSGRGAAAAAANSVAGELTIVAFTAAGGSQADQANRFVTTH